MKIYDLFEIPGELSARVGGKAANLCAMKKAGMNVPGGFIITDISEGESFEEALLRYKSSKLGCVAVRSSAAGEDGADFSAAGQYETVLCVNGTSELLAAIKKCLASVRRAEAESYNKKLSGVKSADMTVVVQRMIRADAAGVCFLKDPSGREGTLIEAVNGLGESLVSGQAQAEQYLVTPAGVETEGSILTKAQAVNIAKGAHAISESLGFETDAEWAIEEGELWWLQARPVTTSDMPELGEFDVADDRTGHVCYTGNISEMMPGAITPLTRSTSLLALDWGVRKLMIHTRAYKDFEDIPDYSCYFTIANHPVGDMTSYYRMTQAMAFASKPSIDISLCGRELKDSPEPPEYKVGGISKLINFVRYMSAISGNKKTHKMITRLAGAVSFNVSAGAEQLWREIDEKLMLFNETTYYHYLSTAYSASMGAAFNLALAKYFDSDEERDAAVAGCLENIDGIESVDILRSMRAIAREAIAAFPNAASLSWDALRDAVLADKGNVRRTYNEFIKKHGHRAISESEMRSPGWEDDTDGFFRQLSKVVASGGEEAAHSRTGWEQNRDALFAKVSRSDRTSLSFMLKSARNGVCYREYTKSCYVKVADIFKRGYRALAEKLTEQGALPDSDAIYFLTHSEIGRLISGERALVKKALARRRLYPAQQTVRLPDISYGRPIPLAPVVEDTTRLADYSGTPVSRGSCEGRARVVRTVKDANDLKMGEIMVASITDVGWTPYYCLLGALVTEKGAALSHGAVVAREYSLPLVTNIRDITDKINTGDLIRVDGSTGRVTVLDRAAV